MTGNAEERGGTWTFCRDGRRQEGVKPLDSLGQCASVLALLLAYVRVLATLAHGPMPSNSLIVLALLLASVSGRNH